MIDAIIHKTVILARSALAFQPIVNNAAGFTPLKELDKVVANAVEIALALGGLACFAMLLAGGFIYLAAGGDDKAIKKAKDTLTYAVAGLVVVVGAYLILNTLFGVNVLNFGPIDFALPS